MIVYYNNKEINISVKKVDFLGKVTGLMFKSRDTDNLLFENYRDSKMAIHSFFVFSPFLAIWLDEKDRAIEFRKVKPFTFSLKPEKKFRKMIEIPFNDRNREIIGFFVGKRKI